MYKADYVLEVRLKDHEGLSSMRGHIVSGRIKQCSALTEEEKPSNKLAVILQEETGYVA